MQQILLNMANHLLIEYCRDKGIDCSGTYTVKNGRGFAYVLRKRAADDKRWLIIARVTFHKSQVPTFGF